MQLGKIIELRRLFLVTLALHVLNRNLLVLQLLHKRLCLLTVHYGRIVVLAIIQHKGTGIHTQCEIFLWYEFADFRFPVDNHSQCQCLHTTGRKLCIEFTGQRAGGVQPDEPVCLSPTYRTAVKGFIFSGILQMRKALLDRLICL